MLSSCARHDLIGPGGEVVFVCIAELLMSEDVGGA